MGPGSSNRGWIWGDGTVGDTSLCPRPDSSVRTDAAGRTRRERWESRAHLRFD